VPPSRRRPARKHDIILGLFLFGTTRVAEFLDKEFRFISVGNDLHHVLTQSSAYVKDVEAIGPVGGPGWQRRPSHLIG
jgi:4-hydroxy-2-oxoheptanedioate aldolase